MNAMQTVKKYIWPLLLYGCLLFLLVGYILYSGSIWPTPTISA